MNRRDLLKLLPLAGLGLWTGGSGRALASPAYYLLTDDAAGDLGRLTRSVGSAGLPMVVSRTAVEPSAQDLTVLIGGVPVDPARGRLPAPLSRLARELRQRDRPAHTLLAFEPRDAPDGTAILFEVDGVPVERIPADRDYRRIVIPGVQGGNVFRLEGGNLSVVETSCRHQLCRKTGARSSGRIICAPNRVVATLPRPYGLVDAITG